MDATHDGLARLAAAGAAIWLDDAGPATIRGSLGSLIERRGVVGVVLTPASLAQAAQADDGTRAALERFVREGASPDEAALALCAREAQAACDALYGVHTSTEGRDGWVSAPVDPRLAGSSDALAAQARALHALVQRPNLLVAIPASRAGLAAIRTAVSEGISVNATGIFDLDRFRAVQAAYVEGLERAEYAGFGPESVASVASLPQAPFDTALDARLDVIATDDAAALRGKVAIANAVLAYREFESRLTQERWRDLAATGARPQRPLWTATTIEDPSYRRTRYVDELVAPGVVAAITETMLVEVADDVEVGPDTIHAVYAAAQQVVDDAERVGLSYTEVTHALERQALEQDAEAWTALLERAAGARAA